MGSDPVPPLSCQHFSMRIKMIYYVLRRFYLKNGGQLPTINLSVAPTPWVREHVVFFDRKSGGISPQEVIF